MNPIFVQKTKIIGNAHILLFSKSIQIEIFRDFDEKLTEHQVIILTQGT
jgi:hypothetical protein